ncbi:hypothetical protein GCM10023185_01540 [Hymenobacter saemangeumensis]|uniref:Lipoprotein n=1 Tax=Hymenobacter saemangeumensis TaxID=1084522 RepID=A0ABP8HXH0_9BACT
MKNQTSRLSLPLALAVLLLGGISASCEKKEQIKDLTQTAGQAGQAEATSEKDYELVYETTKGMVDEKTSLRISKAEGGYLFALIKEPGSQEKVVCSGGQNPGVGFASCVRNYVIANGCCMVTYSASAGWTGNSCPN